MKDVLQVTISTFLLGPMLAACAPVVQASDGVTSSTLESVPSVAVESSPIQRPSEIPSDTPQPLGGLKTYRDENAGIALDYPAAWELESNALQDAAQSVAYTSGLFSWNRASHTPTPKDPNTLPEGATSIDITVFNQGPGTLADAVRQFKNQDSGSKVNVLKEEDWRLNDGGKAVYVESEGALGVVGTMIAILNGRVIYVSGYGNLAPFRTIALTLRAY